MLMRYDPFRELDRFAPPGLNNVRLPAVMPMDAYRRGDEFIVHFDLPGVDPESIELTVEKNELSVKATRALRKAEGDEVIVSERPQGTFIRQLFLGEGLDPERIQANYDHGVLSCIVPVAEGAKPRKVEIHSGSQQRTIDASTS